MRAVISAGFVDDFRLARESFVAAARDAGAQLQTLASARRGPRGEALSTDVAILGDEDAPAALLVSSGVHGVEGAVGSAVQRGWLAQRPSLPPGLRVVLVHAVNPWGFAHGRRTDAQNVDINRNFLLPGECYAGAPHGLARYADVVMPRSPGRRLDLVGLRLGALVMARGRAYLQRLFTSGQHEHAQGLFHGGLQPAESTRLVQAHYAGWLGRARDVLHVDLHSGLGRHGSTLLLAQCEPEGEDARLLRRVFAGTRVSVGGGPPRLAEEWRGGMGRWLAELPAASLRRFLFCTLEFGTAGPVAVFAALRGENRAWWQASARHAAAARRLREAFAPSATGWRRLAVRRGVDLLARAASAWAVSPRTLAPDPPA